MQERDLGSIPGSGRFPGGGNGNPLQYSRLENPMDRGAWWAAVHRVTQSQTFSTVAKLSIVLPIVQFNWVSCVVCVCVVHKPGNSDS